MYLVISMHLGNHHHLLLLHVVVHLLWVSLLVLVLLWEDPGSEQAQVSEEDHQVQSLLEAHQVHLVSMVVVAQSPSVQEVDLQVQFLLVVQLAPLEVVRFLSVVVLFPLEVVALYLLEDPLVLCLSVVGHLVHLGSMVGQVQFLSVEHLHHFHHTLVLLLLHL